MFAATFCVVFPVLVWLAVVDPYLVVLPYWKRTVVLHPLGLTLPFSVVLLRATLLAALVVTVGAAHGVALGVGVVVGVGGAVGVAVGVGVGVAVGVGVGLIVLAVCMATISLSDNAVFQIAACWMLPLAYAVVPLYRRCIKVVRLHVLPVVRVVEVEATLVPSTNRLNTVRLRLNATECQFPSNAVPAEKLLAMTLLWPRA